MTPMMYGIKPEDWERRSITSLTDTSDALGIRYTGTQAAAHVSVDTTTSDCTFEQGATTTAADVSTGDNPGTSGVIDMSALSPKTFHSFQLDVNAAADWECWLLGARPDLAPEASGTGILMVESDLDCTPAAGNTLQFDDSDAKKSVVGFTNWGPSTNPHNHDGNVLHELLQVKGTFSFTGAATLKVYECDDVDGTATEILNIGAAATTVEKAYPTDAGIGEPIAATKSKRMVVEFTAATTLVTSDLFALARTYAYGPGIRKSKLESSY